MVWVGFYGWQERDALVDAAKEGSGIASLVDLWSALGMQRAKDMVNTRGNLLKGIAGLSFSYTWILYVYCVYIYIYLYKFTMQIYPFINIYALQMNVCCILSMLFMILYVTSRNSEK